MNSRIQQLDFLKCICIVLMVAFHLVFIGEKFPYAKEVVYTFHMPVFLLISGYLTRIKRPALRFLKSQFWIFIPYLALELPYMILSGMLGVRGAESDLSLQHLSYRVFADPMGPYWYLHTLIICNITLWTIHKLLHKAGWLFQLATFGIALAALVYGTGLVADNVLYYFFGVAISLSGITFMQIFRPSLPALFLGGTLCCFPANLHYNAPGGIAITYFAVNFMLWIFVHCSEKTKQTMLFLGRNTLPIFLFSPIFTMAVKPLVPILSFDPTGMIFLILATSIAISGSLVIAWCMDKLKVSPWFCGRPTLLCHQPSKQTSF